MDFEGIMLSEISQRQIPCDITYMWNLKKYNKLVNITKQQQTHRYREQTSGYQWGGGNIGPGGTNYWDRLKGGTVQHREYSQSFVITVNGV